jgi:hypothetical protein
MLSYRGVPAAADPDHAKTTSPFQFAIVNHGDTDAWHVQRCHAIAQGGDFTGLAFDQDGRHQRVLNVLNMLLSRGRSRRGDRGGTRCGGPKRTEGEDHGEMRIEAISLGTRSGHRFEPYNFVP